MLVHRWRWWSRKRATARGGGYFFPLRRKKVTKKGATSLEEAIFFLCRAGLYSNIVPAHTATGAAQHPNASAPPHAGAKPIRG
ncbi:MAG: hypothetical protein LBO63_05970 [Oscillospiraceae bacterium]|jgi:hypothetical protein|nr:hypothetical protein [Oscillospiraceae bacterium]